eukprot:m.218566 g.218566  ORF g.218566 m.218566 type:complete len:293 (-) comp25712_c0_seq1:102-980(-)
MSAEALVDDGSGFTLVTRKRGGGRGRKESPTRTTAGRGAPPAGPAASAGAPDGDGNGDPGPDEETIRKRLIAPTRELARVEYVEKVLGVLLATPVLRAGKAVRLVGYGIGNFGSSAVPRLQYCCFRELARRLDLAAPAELFDPVMTASEIAVAAADGIRAPRVNEAAKRKCHGDPTVFFMPHCGKELYDNLLWANWTVPHLAAVVILGNSFAFYVENAIGDELKKTTRYLAAACGCATEVVLENPVAPSAAFNNTSVHHFAVDRLERLPASTWDEAAEPIHVSGHEVVDWLR